MIQAAIVSIMRGNAELVGLLAEGESGVFAGAVPSDSSLSAISYQIVSKRPLSTLSMDSQDFECRIQINTISSNYTDALYLSEKLQEVLVGFKGVFDSISIHGIQLKDCRDDINSLPSVSRIINDFSIQFSKGA